MFQFPGIFRNPNWETNVVSITLSIFVSPSGTLQEDFFGFFLQITEQAWDEGFGEAGGGDSREEHLLGPPADTACSWKLAPPMPSSFNTLSQALASPAPLPTA